MLPTGVRCGSFACDCGVLAPDLPLGALEKLDVSEVISGFSVPAAAGAAGFALVDAAAAPLLLLLPVLMKELRRRRSVPRSAEPSWPLARDAADAFVVSGGMLAWRR